MGSDDDAATSFPVLTSTYFQRCALGEILRSGSRCRTCWAAVGSGWAAGTRAEVSAEEPGIPARIQAEAASLRAAVAGGADVTCEPSAASSADRAVGASEASAEPCHVTRCRCCWCRTACPATAECPS